MPGIRLRGVLLKNRKVKPSSCSTMLVSGVFHDTVHACAPAETLGKKEKLRVFSLGKHPNRARPTTPLLRYVRAYAR